MFPAFELDVYSLPATCGPQAAPMALTRMFDCHFEIPSFGMAFVATGLLAVVQKTLTEDKRHWCCRIAVMDSVSGTTLSTVVPPKTRAEWTHLTVRGQTAAALVDECVDGEFVRRIQLYSCCHGGSGGSDGSGRTYVLPWTLLHVVDRNLLGFPIFVRMLFLGDDEGGKPTLAVTLHREDRNVDVVRADIRLHGRHEVKLEAGKEVRQRVSMDIVDGQTLFEAPGVGFLVERGDPLDFNENGNRVLELFVPADDIAMACMSDFRVDWLCAVVRQRQRQRQ
jgi:hypothetical protein